MRLPRKSAKTKTFGLVKCELITRTKKKYIQLSDDEKAFVDNINKQLKLKTINELDAEKRLRDYADGVNSRQKTGEVAFNKSIACEYNQKILAKFITDRLSKRELVDENSFTSDYTRAVAALADTHIDSGVDSIKARLKHLQTRKLKRTYARLNEIRKWIGIDDRLTSNKVEITEIEHITEEELAKLLVEITESGVRSAVATLFATGLRLGELLGLRQEDLRGDVISVQRQRRKTGEVALPKRGKTGRVLILDSYIDDVKQFIQIKDKQNLRAKMQAEVTNAGKKTLGRHIHVHDLRHSHAIHLLSMGASLTQVSQQLRNRIEVCQKYYTGFAHTDETVELLKKTIKTK